MPLIASNTLIMRIFSFSFRHRKGNLQAHDCCCCKICVRACVLPSAIVPSFLEAVLQLSIDVGARAALGSHRDVRHRSTTAVIVFHSLHLIFSGHRTQMLRASFSQSLSSSADHERHIYFVRLALGSINFVFCFSKMRCEHI